MANQGIFETPTCRKIRLPSHIIHRHLSIREQLASGGQGYLKRLRSYRMQTVIVQRPVALTTLETEDADGTTPGASLSIESLTTNGSENF